jgi:hypothetical protein
MGNMMKEKIVKIVLRIYEKNVNRLFVLMENMMNEKKLVLIVLKMLVFVPYHVEIELKNEMSNVMNENIIEKMNIIVRRNVSLCIVEMVKKRGEKFVMMV